jgi:hypothetical protein
MDKKTLALELTRWYTSIPDANVPWARALFAAGLDQTRDGGRALEYAKSAYAKEPDGPEESVENAKDALGHGSNKKQAGFELVPGVKSIKKAADHEFTGTKLVTLDNGDVHPIFFDRQSGVWHHGNHTTDSRTTRGMIATQKDEVLPRLVKRAAAGEFVPNPKEGA